MEPLHDQFCLCPWSEYAALEQRIAGITNTLSSLFNDDLAFAALLFLETPREL